MLQLEHISKSYTTNDFTQVALDDVSLAFRDNEFVSILGPSGSGKTTLLNVVGGLDHFDSGDLLIDGISTKQYRDRDWDAYRNNRIGFVFQSYNLIPHQTILANVELALTLSGVNAGERRERARKALEDVGLGEHVDKRPSQLSGGQMQRVAIARALINDPEILLADEPTGALDSKTSVQVMDLLRAVAADRLVIMVTHNPELARTYSTRIVELADGRICSDTDPYVPTPDDARDAKPARRTSMSFLTALSLSFNNLMTKKGRTLMTAFAGSIGIIGIAAILALANGVNAYIHEVEEETLSVYPLQIMNSGFDMTSMMLDVEAENDVASQTQEENAAEGTVRETRMVTSMFGRVGKNDLASLKEYLDSDGGGINSYVQDIEYLYSVVPQIYDVDDKGKARQINPDTSFAALGFGGSSSSLMSSSFSTNVFDQMPADIGLIEDQFDVRAGRWPKAYDELVLVLSRKGTMSDYMSYTMGLRDHKELEDMVQSFADQEEVDAPTDTRTYSLDELMAKEFRVLPACDLYSHDEKYDVWTSKASDQKFIDKTMAEAHKLKIVGVVQPKEDVDATTISMGIYYTPALTSWLMEQAAASDIVKDQLARPDINVLSGKSFDQEAEEEGSRFDMSSLFSIDEDKVAQAFSFDESALDGSSLDLSGLGEALDLSDALGDMDFSDVELPELDMSAEDLQAAFADVSIDSSALDLSAIDWSDIDMSQVDLTVLMTPALLEALAPDLSGVDIMAAMEGIEPTVDEEAMAPIIEDVMMGFTAYLAQNPIDPTDPDAMSQAMSDYFSQPEVAASIAMGMQGAISYSEEDMALIQQRILAQIRFRTPEEVWASLSPEDVEELSQASRQILSQLGDQVVQKVVPQIAEQISSQLAEQLEQALSDSLGTLLQSYLEQVVEAYMGAMAEALSTQLESALTEALQGSMEQLSTNLADAISIDEEAFAEAFEFNMSEEELGELMVALMSTERTSLDNNLSKLGYAQTSKPSEIDIYPIDFDSKASVIGVLDDYNEAQRKAGDKDKVVTYTDLVGALMSSVTDIVNMISYVLVAFVAISLVVSSIMIGVITYISVLERKKEIGILRSIGASKRDVSRVFNAETVIEGLVSGIMGVGITALGCIPANAIVEANFDVVRVARLPLSAALVLVCVSVLLSSVAGLLPARKAAKADPVEALRSE